MSLETTLALLLGPPVAGRVYPDTPPDQPTFPLIVYQQVGGSAREFMDQTIPDRDNARMQIVVWSRTRAEASAIAKSMRDAIVGGDLQATTLAAPVSTYNGDLKLYGSRTDFSLWYLR